MWSPKTEQTVHEMTAETADLIGKLLKKECAGWGDQTPALQRIARRAGVSFWTIEHIRKGKAKSVSQAVQNALRGLYLDICESQIRALQNEIAAEKAKGAADDLHGIEAETEALVARLAAARASSVSRTR